MNNFFNEYTYPRLKMIRLTLFTISKFMEQDEIRVSFIARNSISVHRKSMFHLPSFSNDKKSLVDISAFTHNIHRFITLYNKYEKYGKYKKMWSSSRSF